MLFRSFILEKEATKVKSTETTTLTLFNIPRVVKDSEIKSDICTLAKDPGTCENSTERYYYDSESERCLVFAYSGQYSFYFFSICELIFRKLHFFKAAKVTQIIS